MARCQSPRLARPNPSGPLVRLLPAVRWLRFASWLVLASGWAAVAGCAKYDYELGGSSSRSGVAGAGGSDAGAAAGSGNAEASAGAEAGLVGWAAVADCGPAGTTGGASGPTVTATTASELAAAAAASGPSVIQVAGRIELGDVVLEISSDKTLIGLDGATVVGSVQVHDATNVILQYLKFDGGPTQETADTVEVSGSTCVWIDHCEFFDGADGNLDIVRGSDLVTVSWSRFHYVTKSHDHRYSNLCGNTNTDTPGRLNVTFHHNWWGASVLAQMPRVRHGKVHVFNNYYSATGNEYCVGAGYLAMLLVQNNYFDGVADPIRFQFDEEEEGSGVHTAEVVETGNEYHETTGTVVSRGSAFEPPYQYVLEPAVLARDSVVSRAGVR